MCPDGPAPSRWGRARSKARGRDTATVSRLKIRQTVFPPVISARACLIVGEVVPCISISTVILPHGSPLPFAQIGSPFLPGHGAFLSIQKTFVLSAGIRVWHDVRCSGGGL